MLSDYRSSWSRSTAHSRTSASWTLSSTLTRCANAVKLTTFNPTRRAKVHHILSEIIQGGLVLETNVEEIDNAGTLLFSHTVLTATLKVG